MTVRPRLLIAALVGVAALAWGVERLIVTDREAIEGVIEDARRAVLADEWEAFAETIDPAYDERGLDRAGLVSWARGLWRRSGSRALGVSVTAVRVEGDRAAARLVVRPGFAVFGEGFGGRLEFVRRDAGWLISSVSPEDASFTPR
jgi:hypothetical protein